MRLTRRQWTVLFSSAPLAAKAVQSPATLPANAALGASLEQALADVQKVSDRLAKLEVPMNVEPAFQFKA